MTLTGWLILALVVIVVMAIIILDPDDVTDLFLDMFDIFD